jgi:hypothetical protein
METIGRYEQYVANLQLLNRVLADSPVAGRYGVFGGLLLGIVREGKPLPGDWDADFYYLDTDAASFEASIPLLLNAGFERLYRFVANDRIAWEYSFLKDDAKFEFFRTTLGDDGCLYYYDFVTGGKPLQQWKSFRGVPLCPMHFLDCTWLVVDDLDAGLTSVYGNWRTPDPKWTWANDPLAIDQELWTESGRMNWREET